MKTISLYQLKTESIKITQNLLTEDALHNKRFKPLGASDMKRVGFSFNLDGLYVSDQKGDLLLTITEQEKKIEPNAIKIRIKEFEKSYAEINEGDLPTKKLIEDETHKIVEELLPITFPKEEKKYKVLLRKDGLVLVEANGKKAEDLINVIRNAIESFPVVPYEPETSVGDLLDELILPSVNENTGNKLRPTVHDKLELLNKATLVTPEERAVTIDKGSLYDSEAQDFVKDGSYVTSLQLCYDGVLTFVLKDTLVLSGMKYSETITAEDDPLGTEFLQIVEVNKVIDEVLGHLKVEEK